MCGLDSLPNTRHVKLRFKWIKIMNASMNIFSLLPKKKKKYYIMVHFFFFFCFLDNITLWYLPGHISTSLKLVHYATKKKKKNLSIMALWIYDQRQVHQINGDLPFSYSLYGRARLRSTDLLPLYLFVAKKKPIWKYA
jgi:hypothetical protein